MLRETSWQHAGGGAGESSVVRRTTGGQARLTYARCVRFTCASSLCHCSPAASELGPDYLIRLDKSSHNQFLLPRLALLGAFFQSDLHDHRKPLRSRSRSCTLQWHHLLLLGTPEHLPHVGSLVRTAPCRNQRSLHPLLWAGDTSTVSHDGRPPQVNNDEVRRHREGIVHVSKCTTNDGRYLGLDCRSLRPCTCDWMPKIVVNRNKLQ